MFDLSRKIIFTHPQKCAGTTVEGLFGWHPSMCEGGNEPSYIKFFSTWKHASLDNHLNELSLLGEDPLKYFVFSCVRNPWDRAVSLYYHFRIMEPARFYMENPNQELPEWLRVIRESSFDDFVIMRYGEAKRGGFNGLATRPFISSKSGRRPDFIIRHENYLEGLRFVAGKFGLDADAAVSFNTDSRPKGKHYREYYSNDQTISMVAEMAKDSIEEFGYEF